ncbi:MAG: hypothetical protein LBG71_04190 [Clostridiales Family XIII bacterium]|jgi:hypothetical protein|nr:hypothetical protein [Clostridiales Family XIII bacterium]
MAEKRFVDGLKKGAAFLTAAALLVAAQGAAFAQNEEVGGQRRDYGIYVPADQNEPGVYYGFGFENENDGYLLFKQGTAETLTTAAVLSGAAFAPGVGLEDFDLSGLPEGLSLTGVQLVAPSKIELGFRFDGVAGGGLLFEGKPFIDFDAHPYAPKAIGHLTLDLKPSGVEGGNGGRFVSVPVVAEVKRPGVIPYGARLYREMLGRAGSYDYGRAGYPFHQDVLEGAVMDFAYDVERSPYVSQNSYYDIYGSETGSLDILHRYETIQQAAGYSCGLASALTAVNWFGRREGQSSRGAYTLNEQDLSKLRGPGREWGRATSQQELNNVFEGLNAEYGQDWEYVSAYSLRSASPAVVRDPAVTDLDVTGGALDDGAGTEMTLFEAIPWYIRHGVPVIIGSQNWAGHYQVAIGYDDMGTPDISDDVLIMADPYDDSDHLQDGYVIQSYERLINDWSVRFDRNFTNFVFTAAWPKGHDFSKEYVPVPGVGAKLLGKDGSNAAVKPAPPIGAGAAGDAAYKARLAAQIKAWNEEEGSPYKGLIKIGPDGLSGPGGAERFGKGDADRSPYYKNLDFYNLKSGDINGLRLLEGYQSLQQATDYTDGPAALLAALNYYGAAGGLTEIDLAEMRGKAQGSASLGTSLNEMKRMIDGVNRLSGDSWGYVTTDDNLWMYPGDSFGVMYKGEYLESYANFFARLTEAGVPVMVYWHENGGHWQTVIGYDDMGTEAVHDDVLIMADPADVNDHNQDGYVVQSWYRLAYDWGNSTDPEHGYFSYVILYPKASGYELRAKTDGRLAEAVLKADEGDAADRSVNLIMAVYDKRGALNSLDVRNVSVSGAGTYRAVFEPDLSPLGDGGVLRVFAWDADTYAPLAAAYETRSWQKAAAVDAG